MMLWGEGAYGNETLDADLKRLTNQPLCKPSEASQEVKIRQVKIRRRNEICQTLSSPTPDE